MANGRGNTSWRAMSKVRKMRSGRLTRLHGEEEVKDDARVQEINNNLDLQAAIARGETIVKQEKQDASLAELEGGNSKTVELLMSDPKKAMQNLAKIITEAKLIHKDSKPGPGNPKAKFAGDVHTGVTSLLPRLAREYRRIEQIVLGEIDDRKDIGVSAKALDAIFEDFDETEGAAVNLLGRKKRRK